MPSDPDNKERSFGKRDLFAAAVVVMYLVIAGGAMEAWSFLSQKADAFAAARHSIGDR